MTSICGSDIKGFQEFMGRDAVLPDKHPIDECSGGSRIDDHSRFNAFGGTCRQEDKGNPKFSFLSYSLSYTYEFRRC
jgi:hypothetical protein